MGRIFQHLSWNRQKSKTTNKTCVRNESDSFLSTKYSSSFSVLESWRLVMFENSLTQSLNCMLSRSHRKPGRKGRGRVIRSILLSLSKSKSSSYNSPDRGFQEKLLFWGRRAPTKALQLSVTFTESFFPAVLSTSSPHAHSRHHTATHRAVSVLCLQSSPQRFYWLSSDLQRQASVTLSFV